MRAMPQMTLITFTFLMGPLKLLSGMSLLRQEGFKACNFYLLILIKVSFPP